MVWLNPPPTVLQWRTQLMESPTLAGAPWNLVEANFHYPTLNPTQTNPNLPAPDQMPCMLLAELGQVRERYAEGAIGLITGQLIADLFVANGFAGGSDAGSLETLMRQVIIDLQLQYYGFNFKTMETKLATLPSPGMRAAGADTTQATFTGIRLWATYGLNRR